MNQKGYGNKQSWSDLRYYAGICLPGGIEENHKNLSEYPVSRSRFEPGNF
jgi:hypothetical protein